MDKRPSRVVTFANAGPGEHQLTLSDPPYPRLVEGALSGGNTHEVIVRIDRTVRRPTGLWTPGVHALLGHLEKQGFDCAPRVRGIDEQGREVLDYVEGEVVHPDNDRLLVPDAALAEVVVSIRRFHDAVESFADPERFQWSDRGGDPRGPHEIVCLSRRDAWSPGKSRKQARCREVERGFV